MKEDFVWKAFPEPIITRETLNNPLEFASCLSEEGFTELTIFTPNMKYYDMGYEQFQIAQGCTPEGSLINAFMHSEAVTTYADFCNYLWTLLPF